MKSALTILMTGLLSVAPQSPSYAAERTYVLGFGKVDLGVRYDGTFDLSTQGENKNDIVAHVGHFIHEAAFEGEVGMAPGVEFHVLVPFRIDDRRGFQDAYYLGFDPDSGLSTFNTGLDVPSSALTKKVRRGFGDIWLGFTASPMSETFAKPNFGTLSLDLSIKIPTAPSAFKNISGDVWGFGSRAVDVRGGFGFSKRWRDIEPYIWAEFLSTGAHKQDLTDRAGTVVTADAPINPSDEATMSFGAEAIATENTAVGTKFAVDFRLAGSYMSPATWEAGHYLREIAPATEGLLVEEDEYLRVSMGVGLYVYVQTHFKMQLNITGQWRTAHFLETVDGGNYPVYLSAQSYTILGQFQVQAHF